MIIVPAIKKIPSLSCAKIFGLGSFCSVLTSMPAPTTTPEGKKEVSSTQ